MNIVWKTALFAAMLAPFGAMNAPPAEAVAMPAGPGSAEELTAAANRYAARLKELELSGQPLAALKAPADIALFRAAFDADSVRALPDDVLTVITPCEGVANAYKALVSYISLPRAGQTLGQQVLSAQDELVIALVTTDLCTKKMLRAAIPFVEALPEDQRDPVRRNGVGMMQLGARQMITGMLMVQSDPGLTVANRARIIAGLFEDIAVVAAAIAPADRIKVRDEILGYADRADVATKTKLRQLARAFDLTGCGTLCSFVGA